MVERDEVPDGGWYTEECTDAQGVRWWCINERQALLQGDGDMWRAQTGSAMEDVADEICRFHNDSLNTSDKQERR